MNTHDLTLFIRTADTGSITRAAEQLDISTAAASAGLKRLEKHLEVELFIRTTRQLRITAEGERFLVFCRRAMESLDEGKASMHALKGVVGGELRISAPSDLGRNVLCEWLDDFMEQHPGLTVNLLLGDSLADFYLDRVDVAIRYGEQPDSSMVAFKLATADRVLCASPEYLTTRGIPTSPRELAEHNCLLYQLHNRNYDTWEFTDPNHNEHHRISVQGNRSTNDADLVRRWAVDGRGIAYKSRLDMQADLRAGRVIEVLADYPSTPIDLNLLCPSRQQVTQAVLILRDTLRTRFSNLAGQT
tara:strand:- start:4286 stop:5191 length:906 start_codon:yes stop_codon:yes gene_type:complete